MKTVIPTRDLVHASTSPFDSIRRIDAEGREYWTARDLMPPMAYPRWHRFEPVIQRAMAAARNVNDSAAVFTLEGKNPSEQGGRAPKDYRLSRAAAYYVAMNGDPSKPEVAAAQAYFVRRTREAELAQSQFAIPTTFAGALALAAEQAAALEETRSEVAELVATNAKLSPRARVADQYEANPGITPTVFHKTHFTAVPERDFFEHLYRKDYLIDQRNARWDERNGEWKEGPEHRHPAAKGKRYFYLAPRLDRNGVRRQQTLVIPGDAEHDLVAALERDGLPSRNRPALPGSQVVRFPQARRQLGGAS